MLGIVLQLFKVVLYMLANFFNTEKKKSIVTTRNTFSSILGSLKLRIYWRFKCPFYLFYYMKLLVELELDAERLEEITMFSACS